MSESVMNRHNRTDVVISPPDEFHPLLGGDGALGLAASCQPAPSELRQMLRSVRKRFGWSQSFAAAVLGVTKSAITKWECGERVPTGAAAKLIFLLHAQLLDPSGKVRNVWDLAFWGRIPCRDSIRDAAWLGKALELKGTYFVPERVLDTVVGAGITPEPQAPVAVAAG